MTYTMLTFLSAVLACGDSHPPESRDAGIDGSVDSGPERLPDAGRDASHDDHCAASGVTFPDGMPQPTCRPDRISCSHPTYYPEGALCEYGLCCGGSVDPTTCECRCGEGPPCTGFARSCCHADTSEPHLRDLDPEAFYCLVVTDCAEL
jgi:hypothetical protein